LNKTWVRWFGAIVILFLIYHFRNQFVAGLKEVAQARPSDYIYALLLQFLSVFVHSLRVKYIYSNFAKMVKAVPSMFLCYMSSIELVVFNTFVFTGAGDLRRIKFFMDTGITASSATALAGLDRMFGVMSLMSFFLLGVFIFTLPNEINAMVGTVIAMGAVILIVGSLFYFYLNRKGEFKFKSPLPFVALYLLAVVATGCWIFSVILLARAIDLPFDHRWFFIIAPTVAVMSIIPLTIGGLGVREAGYGGLFKLWGQPVHFGVTMGLLQYTQFIAFGIFMILVWSYRAIRKH
jgi:uncharacterized membrane protein YbhN (UPF0104 family)